MSEKNYKINVLIPEEEVNERTKTNARTRKGPRRTVANKKK